MLSQTTRDDLERLPWRGPVEPVLMDAPDSLQPKQGGVNRVKIFDMDNDEHVREYERILNRDDRGVSQIRATQTANTPSGGFRIMLAWAENYMCAHDYVPSEGRAVLRSSKVRAADIDDEGVDTGPGDDEVSLKKAVREWARESSVATARMDDPDEAEDGGAPSIVGEPLDFDDGVAPLEESELEPDPGEEAEEDTRESENGS